MFRSTYEVWGIRKTDDGRVQVELRPIDNHFGHVTVFAAENEAPELGATVEASYAVMA